MRWPRAWRSGCTLLRTFVSKLRKTKFDGLHPLPDAYACLWTRINVPRRLTKTDGRGGEYPYTLILSRHTSFLLIHLDDSAIPYANPGGSPDNVGAWVGAQDIWSSFEFPSGSFRVWWDPRYGGSVLEELRYESWECTDVVGVARTEYVSVKIATNGTAFTRTGCFTTKLSEDLTYVQKKEHECGEEPALTPDGSWFTNFRLNSTAVPAPTTLTCNGAPVTLDTSGIAPYYEGVGSVARESSYVGDVYPPFESVNSNGLPDYSKAKGKPFIDGLTYTNNEEDELSSFAIRTNGAGIRATAKAGNGTNVELSFYKVGTIHVDRLSYFVCHLLTRAPDAHAHFVRSLPSVDRI